MSGTPLELERLEPDPDQRPVLEHARGGLLVTGPPGAGKTALLRERFARLVEGGADPERVGLFAVNRRAARDAREHVLRRLARSLPDLPVLTVHGFAYRVMGRRFGDMGYPEPPQVLSAPEQYAVVREMLVDERTEDWPRFGSLLGTRGFVQQVADFVLRAQERLLDPEALEAVVGEDHREVARFYRRYLDAQRSAGRLDFAGLLRETQLLLSRDLSPAEAFAHLLVDDYQDATHASEAILGALAGAADSLVVAADPAGHVFSYRGGTLEPLGRVRERLGCRERVELTASHRLGDAVSALAPLGDPAAPPAASSPRVDSRLFAHPGEEAEAVAHELLRFRVEDDVPWERMAVVLRRYGPYLSTLRHALARHGIPFVVVAEAADVAKEPANRPVIDLLRFVFREERRTDLLEAVLASPIVGFDPHDLRRLRREARRRQRSLLDVVLEPDGSPLPADLEERLRRFRSVVGRLAQEYERRPDAAFFGLWSELAHFRRLVAEDGGSRDLDALAALGDVMSRFAERRPGATVADYLDTLDAAEFGPDPWVPPEERHPHAVRVVSAHRAHGTEYEVALVVGCLEGEFPSLGHAYPLVDLDEVLSPRGGVERLRARLAEERALFRLAVSRARRRTVLFASHSTGARNPRTPSRFAPRLGASWERPREIAPPAVSLRSMEADLRGRLGDGAASRPARLAALAALEVVGARPADWWWGREWTDPGEPMYPDEIRTSYSRLSSLENCALQYLYGAELGLDTERTHYMWLGNAIHDILDRAQRGELPREEEALVAALDEAWRPGAFPNRAVEHQRYQDARRMLRRWLDDPEIHELEVVASEADFRYPLDGAVIRGKIDAVLRGGDGRLRVLDYKTSRTTPSEKELPRHLQLAAYFLAMRRVPELRKLGEAALIGLVFPAIPRREGMKRMEFRPREGYEEWAEETLRDLLSRVREERFAPNPEADCFFCRFKPICPVWREGGEVPA